MDGLRSDSNPSVHSGYHSYAGGPSVLGASGTTFPNKMPSLPWFSGTEREKDTVSLNSGFIPSLISMISG